MQKFRIGRAFFEFKVDYDLFCIVSNGQDVLLTLLNAYIIKGTGKFVVFEGHITTYRCGIELPQKLHKIRSNFKKSRSV